MFDNQCLCFKKILAKLRGHATPEGSESYSQSNEFDTNVSSNQIQLKPTGKYVDCQELVHLDEHDYYDPRDASLPVDLRNLQLDSLVHLSSLLNQPDSSYREQNAADHWELQNMSATTESAANGTTKGKTSPVGKLKPVAKRSSLDANTVPARRSTSGVYQLIKPKRTSLDSPPSNSLLASPDGKSDTNNNLSSSGLKPNSSSRSSPSSTLLSTPKFDTAKDNLSTISSQSKSSSSTSSPTAGLSANGDAKRRLSMDKKTLNGISEEELNCAFQLLDINSDGSISKQELKEMLLSLNIHADDSLIDQMIMEVTRNENGMINKEQFYQLMNNFKDKEDDIDRDLWAAFQVFDRDGNGFLSKDELELAMKMMGEEFEEKDINHLMRMTDLDNDGRISFQEFKIKFRMLN